MQQPNLHQVILTECRHKKNELHEKKTNENE